MVRPALGKGLQRTIMKYLYVPESLP
jgi:hypothetical protein